MIQKKTGRKRPRISSTAIPTRARIAREQAAIRNGWSGAERIRRRIDSPASPLHDSRLQAQIRFIQFLVELEKQGH